MSKGVKYLLVSLPTNITLANEHDEALTALRSAVTTDNGTTVPFKIPEFKIGTLDALVQQADELAKLESGCEGVVSKVGDSLRTILEGDDEKIAQQKTVNDSQSDQESRQDEVARLTPDQSQSISISSLSTGTRSNIGQTSPSGSS